MSTKISAVGRATSVDGFNSVKPFQTKHNGKVYTLAVQQFEGTDDFFVELPQELCEEAGWECGDKLTWTQMPSGTWHLQKVKA